MADVLCTWEGVVKSFMFSFLLKCVGLFCVAQLVFLLTRYHSCISSSLERESFHLSVLAKTHRQRKKQNGWTVFGGRDVLKSSVFSQMWCCLVRFSLRQLSIMTVVSSQIWNKAIRNVQLCFFSVGWSKLDCKKRLIFFSDRPESAAGWVGYLVCKELAKNICK